MKGKGTGEKMSQLEMLNNEIEKERKKLDSLIAEDNLEETYRQSLVVDKLVERYIRLTDK